jgi:hypothetical protein
MHLRADIGGHGQLLDLDLPGRRDGNKGHIRGPACSCPFLRRDTGNAHAFALRKLQGAVIGSDVVVLDHWIFGARQFAASNRLFQISSQTGTIEFGDSIVRK